MSMDGKKRLDDVRVLNCLKLTQAFEFIFWLDLGLMALEIIMMTVIIMIAILSTFAPYLFIWFIYLSLSAMFSNAPKLMMYVKFGKSIYSRSFASKMVIFRSIIILT